MSTKYTFHFEYTHLLVVFFTLFFLFQIILGYNRLGKKYCAQYLNLLNYPIVFFSMGMIISLLLQKYLTESKISDFQSEGHETFFSFFQYKTFSRFLLNCQLLIIISLTLKLLFLGQVGQMSKNCMYTLILAKQQIFITCCLLVPLSWLMSAPISYLLGTQLFPQTTAVIFNRLSFKKVSQNSVFSHVKLPTVLFSFIHSFMSFVCTAFIVHFHLTVKGYTKNVKSEVNPFKFAFDQLKLICCRKHAYRKVRLRGGADLEFSSRKSKNINIKTCFVSAYLMCRVKQTEPKKVCSTLGEHLFKTVKYSKSYHNSLTKVYCEDVLYKLDVISKTINELN